MINKLLIKKDIHVPCNKKSAVTEETIKIWIEQQCGMAKGSYDQLNIQDKYAQMATLILSWIEKAVKDGHLKENDVMVADNRKALHTGFTIFKNIAENKSPLTTWSFDKQQLTPVLADMELLTYYCINEKSDNYDYDASYAILSRLTIEGALIECGPGAANAIRTVARELKSSNIDSLENELKKFLYFLFDKNFSDDVHQLNQARFFSSQDFGGGNHVFGLLGNEHVSDPFASNEYDYDEEIDYIRQQYNALHFAQAETEQIKQYIAENLQDIIANKTNESKTSAVIAMYVNSILHNIGATSFKAHEIREIDEHIKTTVHYDVNVHGKEIGLDDMHLWKTQANGEMTLSIGQSASVEAKLINLATKRNNNLAKIDQSNIKIQKASVINSNINIVFTIKKQITFAAPKVIINNLGYIAPDNYDLDQCLARLEEVIYAIQSTQTTLSQNSVSFNVHDFKFEYLEEKNEILVLAKNEHGVFTEYLHINNQDFVNLNKDCKFENGIIGDFVVTQTINNQETTIQVFKPKYAKFIDIDKTHIITTLLNLLLTNEYIVDISENKIDINSLAEKSKHKNMIIEQINSYEYFIFYISNNKINNCEVISCKEINNLSLQAAELFYNAQHKSLHAILNVDFFNFMENITNNAMQNFILNQIDFDEICAQNLLCASKPERISYIKQTPWIFNKLSEKKLNEIREHGVYERRTLFHTFLDSEEIIGSILDNCPDVINKISSTTLNSDAFIDTNHVDDLNFKQMTLAHIFFSSMEITEIILNNHPDLIYKISDATLNTIIDDDVYNGRTLAHVLFNSNETTKLVLDNYPGFLNRISDETLNRVIETGIFKGLTLAHVLFDTNETTKFILDKYPGFLNRISDETLNFYIGVGKQLTLTHFLFRSNELGEKILNEYPEFRNRIYDNTLKTTIASRYNKGKLDQHFFARNMQKALLPVAMVGIGMLFLYNRNYIQKFVYDALKDIDYNPFVGNTVIERQSLTCKRPKL